MTTTPAAPKTPEPVSKPVTLRLDLTGPGRALFSCATDPRLWGIVGRSDGRYYVELDVNEETPALEEKIAYFEGRDRKALLVKVAKSFGYTDVTITTEKDY